MSTPSTLANQPQGLMTVREVAVALRVSPRQIWKLNSTHRLPAPVRLCRSVRWRASDIAEFVRLGCPSRDRFEAEIAGDAK
jgi:predicted DNA-binding transcriptional regulator AlpA